VTGVTRTVLPAAGVVVMVAVYALLAGHWASADPGWYDALDKPSWQPPDWVFGVAWSYNFIALAVVGLTLSIRHPGSVALRWLLAFSVSVVFALSWAYLFYVPHQLGAAAAALAVAAALSWVLVRIARRAATWAGWLLVPYAIWMSLATSLAVGFGLA
jgi:tryptophan-rich sensory protein